MRSFPVIGEIVSDGWEADFIRCRRFRKNWLRQETAILELTLFVASAMSAATSGFEYIACLRGLCP